MLRQPDLKAFKLPAAQTLGKTTKQKNTGVKSAVRAALLAGQKPSPRGRDTKAGKRGLRAYGEPWTLHDLASLYFASPKFQDVINSGVLATWVVQIRDQYVADGGTGAIKDIPLAKWDTKTLSQHRAVLLTQLVSMAHKDAALIAGWIAGELAQMLAVVNAAKMHPLDVTDWVTGYVLNGGKGVFNAAKQLLNTTSSGADRMVMLFRTLGANKSKFLNSKSVLLRSVATALEAQQDNGLLAGFHNISDMKVWTAPSSKAAMGLEIAGFTYRVPTSFDANGKPSAYRDFKHATSASRIQSVSSAFRPRTYGEAVEMLSQTPAGRMWLCFDSKGNSPFVAFDRSPRRALFALDVHDPFTALLHGLSVADANRKLVGFIM